MKEKTYYTIKVVLITLMVVALGIIGFLKGLYKIQEVAGATIVDLFGGDIRAVEQCVGQDAYSGAYYTEKVKFKDN